MTIFGFDISLETINTIVSVLTLLTTVLIPIIKKIMSYRENSFFNKVVKIDDLSKKIEQNKDSFIKTILKLKL